MTPVDHKIIASRFRIANVRMTATGMMVAGILMVVSDAGWTLWTLGVGFLVVSSWLNRRSDQAIRELDKAAGL